MRCAQSDIIVTHSVTIIECRVESIECRCCLRANARSTFLFTGSPRFARDDNGE